MFRGDLLRKTERQLCAQGLLRSVFDHTENGGKQDGKEKDKGGSADIHGHNQRGDYAAVSRSRTGKVLTNQPYHFRIHHALKHFSFLNSYCVAFCAGIPEG